MSLRKEMIKEAMARAEEEEEVEAVQRLRWFEQHIQERVSALEVRLDEVEREVNRRAVRNSNSRW